MKGILIILLGLLFWTTSFSQTMVEVTHPADADIVLLQVPDSSDADVIICITQDKKKAKQWDCMWKFKKWGSANFAVYIARDTLSLYTKKEDTFDEEAEFYSPDAKIYFTVYENERGYKNELFYIPGIMRIKRNN